MWNLLIIVFASYLIGSIPAGVIASRIVRGLDIRGYGSGNTGATNVFRVLGWKAGLAVALVDFSKGFVSAFWVSRLRFPDLEPSIGFLLPIFAGCSAVLGHIFPLFAGFRGGKGVATGAGVIVALYPLVALLCLLVFVITLLLSGFVSLSSILTSIALPIFYGLLSGAEPGAQRLAFFIFTCAISLLVLVMHSGNISRLIAGRERRFEKIWLLARFSRKRKSQDRGVP